MITNGLLVFNDYYYDCRLLMLGLSGNSELKEKFFVCAVQNKIYFSTSACNQSLLFQLILSGCSLCKCAVYSYTDLLNSYPLMHICM